MDSYKQLGTFLIINLTITITSNTITTPEGPSNVKRFMHGMAFGAVHGTVNRAGNNLIVKNIHDGATIQGLKVLLAGATLYGSTVWDRTYLELIEREGKREYYLELGHLAGQVFAEGITIQLGANMDTGNKPNFSFDLCALLNYRLACHVVNKAADFFDIYGLKAQQAESAQSKESECLKIEAQQQRLTKIESELSKQKEIIAKLNFKVARISRYD